MTSYNCVLVLDVRLYAKYIPQRFIQLYYYVALTAVWCRFVRSWKQLPGTDRTFLRASRWCLLLFSIAACRDERLPGAETETMATSRHRTGACVTYGLLYVTDIYRNAHVPLNTGFFVKRYIGKSETFNSIHIYEGQPHCVNVVFDSFNVSLRFPTSK